MSEGSLNRARLRTTSLEDIKQRLGMRAISCDVRYLTCNERISSLGQAISRSADNFGIEVPIDISERKILADLAKAVSLKIALEKPEFIFLKERARNYFSEKDLRTVEQAREMVRAGNISNLPIMKGDIASVLENLESAVHRAHTEMARLEMRVITEAAIRSLTDIGYETCVKERDNDLLVRGIREDLSIAVRIVENNELYIDMAGFTDSLCTAEFDRLYKSLDRNGVNCEVMERHHHGKKEGGILAREISREVPFSFNQLEPQIRHNQRGTLLNLNTLKRRIKSR